MRLISDDRKRGVTDEAILGFPAYELQPSDDGESWRGVHVGIFEGAADALRWLETGEPKPKPIPTLR